MELRPYQREAVDAIYKYFEDGGKGNPLIVAPTASGKSILIAKFCEEVLQRWPNQRILILAHRKELLQQNASKILQLWPNAPLGIYSAGLKARQLGRNITIAGIQSVYNKAKGLNWIDIILSDESHLIPSEGDGMYRTLIAGLKEINPGVRVIGFTATPYRMKTGLLTDKGGLFTDIAHEIEILPLIKDGYLCPLISKSGVSQADLSNVGKRGGEFISGEAEAALDKESLTQAAIDEMEQFCADRKSWIVFCQGVAHAQHVAQALTERGHPAEAVVGESEDMFRANTIARFKSGELKVIVNCDVLTTGFDAPNIDALVLLRATGSTGLYVQMLGRGMRIHPSKKDCVVLDFAGNLERHGCIDQIRIKKKRGAKDDSEREVTTAPTKICPKCRLAVPAATVLCGECGHEFIIDKPKHEAKASERPIIAGNSKNYDTPKRLEVANVSFVRNEGKMGKPPSMRVIYEIATEGNLGRSKKVLEWVHIENRKMRDSAVRWWLQHRKPDDHSIDVPYLVDDAVQRAGGLRKPKAIWVQKDGDWDRVVSREFLSPEEEAERDRMKEEQRSHLERLQEEIGI